MYAISKLCLYNKRDALAHFYCITTNNRARGLKEIHTFLILRNLPNSYCMKYMRIENEIIYGWLLFSPNHKTF